MSQADFNARRREQEGTTCRHYRGRLSLNSLDKVETCNAGIRFDSVEAPRGPGGILSNLPCFADGRDRGLTCDGFAVYSAEELNAQEDEMNALFDALEQGKCKCGATLLRRGTVYACPAGCVSGFMCGEKDIREGGP